MAFSIQIVPSALAELKAVKVFDRRRIVQAIDDQLAHQPATPSRHRKRLGLLATSFEHEPPLWELRVGEYRVFYDVEESARAVFVRAVRAKRPHRTTEETV